MFTILIFMTILAIVLTVGGILTARQNGHPLTTVQITAFSILPLAVLGIGAGSYPIGLNAAQADAVGGYHQFLNGSIVATNRVLYQCSEDGSCSHDYACDYYTEEETEYYTDSNGKSQSRQVTVSKHHDCPYATKEFSYTATDSFGNESQLGDHVFDKNPQAWRRGEGIPKDIPRGVPPQWQHASDGIASGNTDPVTVLADYKNFILSSEHTLLKAASSDIALLKNKKLLPDHTANLEEPIYSNFLASKVSFVGVKPPNSASWQDALMRFNAALGTMRQGDMHVVVIKASALPASVSSENYLNAVKAYWLNNLGKNALAKNGIALILAVDDSASTIKWARSTTGMPIGNGPMLQALNTELNDQPFTVDSVFGTTSGRVVSAGPKPKVTYQIGSGLAAQIIMQDFPFQRACMGCEGKEDVGQHGFVNLSTEIPLGGAALVWTIIIDIVICLVLAIGLNSLIGVTLLNVSTGGASIYDSPEYDYHQDSPYDRSGYSPARTPQKKGRKNNV